MNIREQQTKHWKNKSEATIKSYMVSPPANLRSKWFADKLKKYKFKSIFEVGYFASRNIYHIRKEFPEINIAGLEVNPKAVKFAREKMNMGEELMCMDLHDMGKIAERYDIVFSSGVLIHIQPEDISSVIAKMVGLANKYVMHIEQIGNNELCAGPKHLKPSYKVSDQWQFNNDLVAVYKDLGYEPDVILLPEEMRTNGARELIVVKL